MYAETKNGMPSSFGGPDQNGQTPDITVDDGYLRSSRPMSVTHTNKRGPFDTTKTGKQGDRDPRAWLGSKFAAILAQDNAGKSPDEMAEWQVQNWGRDPPVVQAWAETATASLPVLYAAMEAPPGKVSTYLYEVRYAPRSYTLRAADRLQAALLLEQHDPHKRHPIENALRASYWHKNPGEQDGEYLGKLEKVSRSSLLDAEQLDELAMQTRLFHFMFGGDLLMLQKTRPDIVSLEVGEDDREAQGIVATYADILRSRRIYDLDYLRETEFKYEGSESRYFNPSAAIDEQRVALSGIQTVYGIGALMRDQRLVYRATDLKVKTHSGRKWSGTNDVWKEYGNRLEDIFSPYNLIRPGFAFDQLRGIWQPDVLDASKSMLGPWAAMRAGLKEFEPFTDSPKIPMHSLSPALGAGLLYVDFDIRRNDEHYSNDGTPYYQSDSSDIPRLSDLSCPEIDEVTAAHFLISQQEVSNRLAAWQAYVYRTGRIAIRNQVANQMAELAVRSHDVHMQEATAEL